VPDSSNLAPPGSRPHRMTSQQFAFFLFIGPFFSSAPCAAPVRRQDFIRNFASSTLPVQRLSRNRTVGRRDGLLTSFRTAVFRNPCKTTRRGAVHRATVSWPFRSSRSRLLGTPAVALHRPTRNPTRRMTKI
jgi:hypothetical protein